MKLGKLENLNLSWNPFNKTNDDTARFRFKLPALLKLDSMILPDDEEETSDEDEDYQFRHGKNPYRLKLVSGEN